MIGFRLWCLTLVSLLATAVYLHLEVRKHYAEEARHRATQAALAEHGRETRQLVAARLLAGEESKLALESGEAQAAGRLALLLSLIHI